MKLQDAHNKLNKLVGIKFSSLFSIDDMRDIIIAKGKTGQLLELALGMNLSNTDLDFEDGELKTNKCDKNGKPYETIFITQVSGMIDELLMQKSFESTKLYKKVKNILYVPVCKDGDPKNWMFLPSIHVDLSNPKYIELKDIWRDDYYSICGQLKQHIKHSSDGFIHTSNGMQLQIRSKDARDSSGNYHPIYSEIFGRYVSNKNHAFYFKKDFVQYINRVEGRDIY